MTTTKIEWTDETWNPIRARGDGKVGWHCEKVSPGCANCYAERLNGWVGNGLTYTRGNRGPVELFLDEKMLAAPLRWRKPRRVFVCSMTDLFADFVPERWIDRIFAVMALAPQHEFQVLTKRARRERGYVTRLDDLHKSLPGGDGAFRYLLRAYDEATAFRRPGGSLNPSYPPWPLPNVWLGVSAEDQKRLDERAPDLLATPAAVRFVSAEPLLGPLDFSKWGHAGLECSACPWRGTEDTSAGREYTEDGEDWFDVCPECGSETAHVPLDEQLGEGLRWIIVGGESGPGARPMDIAWARCIVRQCREAEVAAFVKQLGSCIQGDFTYFPKAGPPGLGALPMTPNMRGCRLQHPKGGDPSEWPEDLRVREFPA